MSAKQKIFFFVLTLFTTLNVAFIGSMYIEPAGKLTVSNESLSFLNKVDRIPDHIFPLLEDENPKMYLFWREACHLFATSLLMLISFLFYRKGFRHMPETVFIVLTCWITYQEMYLHPLKYHQARLNGLLDWFVWIVPFFVFIYLINKKDVDSRGVYWF